MVLIDRSRSQFDESEEGAAEPHPRRSPGAQCTASLKSQLQASLTHVTLKRLLEARTGRHGKREFVRVLRLMEVFKIDARAAHGRTPDHSLWAR